MGPAVGDVHTVDEGELRLCPEGPRLEGHLGAAAGAPPVLGVAVADDVGHGPAAGGAVGEGPTDDLLVAEVLQRSLLGHGGGPQGAQGHLWGLGLLLLLCCLLWNCFQEMMPKEEFVPPFIPQIPPPPPPPPSLPLFLIHSSGVLLISVSGVLSHSFSSRCVGWARFFPTLAKNRFPRSDRVKNPFPTVDSNHRLRKSVAHTPSPLFLLRMRDSFLISCFLLRMRTLPTFKKYGGHRSQMSTELE